MFKYSDTQNTKIRQLNHLRFYCPTSDFTVRPQNLQYDLRIYSTTSESTVRPQNLQYDLRIYSTTSEFTVRPQSFTVRPGFLEVQILVQPDPAEVYYSLVIEEVVIINQSLKQAIKKDSAMNHQINIYQRAADLLSTIIHPGKASGMSNMAYLHCKSCGVRLSKSCGVSSSSSKNDRLGCISHLANNHSAEYQEFASQLNVAPGPRLDSLLFKALAPGLIFNAKKPQ